MKSQDVLSAGLHVARGVVLSRPTVAEIDLNAIKWNMKAIRGLVGEDVLICPAVKADGYGHGAIQVAKAAHEAGASAFAVATIEEAIELREAGIDIPILNLQCLLADQIAEVMPYDISTLVCSFSQALELSKHAQAASKKAKVHIKVDTGMGRVGVQKEECVDFALKLSQLPGIDIRGIFTHLPSADEEDLGFTREQVASFIDVADAVEASGVHVPLRHAANSAGILRVSESYLDMVRPGIILYGLYDNDPGIELRQAMTLKTRIVFLKELPAGRSVSYGRTFTAARRTRVATLPIGYADGYSRALSNKAQVLVRGKRAPVIGRVCMDQVMVDVTDVPGVESGDEVVLYGTQGNERISILEIAQNIGTITYEVTCSVSKRVPRVYIG